jgi:hypothetical protein
MGLASVFLLGVAVNLTSRPSATSGTAHLASIAFLAAHVLIAIGIVTGTVLLLRAAARLGGRWRRQAIAGTAANVEALLARFAAARGEHPPGTMPVMYETQQIEFRHTDRKRFTEHLLRNGPRAVAEFEKAQQLWAHRPAP